MCNSWCAWGLVTVWSYFEIMYKNLRKETVEAVQRHDRDLEEITKSRHRWLYASSVVYVGIILLIFSWDWIDSLNLKSIWWVVVSLMLILSINWWYWTMRVVRRFVHHRKYEVDLIMNIMYDIKEVKEDVRQLIQEHTKRMGDWERRE